MNPNNYASLEASKRLHDAGIVLETDAVWARDENGWYLRSSFENTDREVLESCPAPSMAEVWRELPEASAYLHTNRETEAWLEDEGDIVPKSESFANINPADALIELLIWARRRPTMIVTNVLYAEITRLKKRVGELKDERDADRRREYGYSQETVDALTAERDKLEAENRRLREALDRIESMATIENTEIQKIAREALSQEV